jgi:hypothetical protein
MKHLTLLTDFGYEDGFVGSMKGVIYKINPSVSVIDLTHQIESFDILEATLILNASFKYFPKYTIFVCVVDPGVGTEREALIVQTENYFFVSPNNGILTLPLKKEKVKKIIKITNKRFFLDTETQTFHGRDVFAPVSAYLSKGVPIEEFGEEFSEKNLVKIEFPEPKKEKGKIVGQILRFDKFGNALTNISQLPEKFKARIKNYEIKVSCKNFMEGSKNNPNLIKGSFGFYEIFVPLGSAKEKFSLKKGDKLEVYIEE